MLQEIKLFVSELIHKQNYLSKPYQKQSKEQEIFAAIKEDGCYAYESFLSEKQCKELREKANEFLKKNPSLVSGESNGADQRVYGVNRHTKEFDITECLNISNNIFSKFSWTFDKDHLLLLGKIEAAEGNLGSGSGWHRDSPFAHQFKTILYLSDVAINNGPFEYVKGSHKYSIIKKYSKKLNIPLSKYRFSEKEIDSLVEHEFINQPTKILGKAGTLLFADVRGLHRGAPLSNGERFALTNYHFATKRSDYYDK